MVLVLYSTNDASYQAYSSSDKIPKIIPTYHTTTLTIKLQNSPSASQRVSYPSQRNLDHKACKITCLNTYRHWKSLARILSSSKETPTRTVELARTNRCKTSTEKKPLKLTTQAKTNKMKNYKRCQFELLLKFKFYSSIQKYFWIKHRQWTFYFFFRFISYLRDVVICIDIDIWKYCILRVKISEYN